MKFKNIHYIWCRNINNLINVIEEKMNTYNNPCRTCKKYF